MTTNQVSPVTESEMNSFFNGVNEFKSRLATNFFAMSEQAREIENLRILVDRLQSSVDALNHSINVLTEERNSAIAERDRALANERAAMQMAEEAERARDEKERLLHGALDEIRQHSENRYSMESELATLRETNHRQEQSLKVAIEENQELQDRISGRDRTVDELRNEVANLHRDHERVNKELDKLRQTLGIAKAVLEDVPPAERDNVYRHPAVSSF